MIKEFKRRLRLRRIDKLVQSLDGVNLLDSEFFNWLTRFNSFKYKMRYVNFIKDSPFDIFIGTMEMSEIKFKNSISTLCLDTDVNVFTSLYKSNDCIDDDISLSLISLQKDRSLVRIDIEKMVALGYDTGFTNKATILSFCQNFVIFTILFRSYIAKNLDGFTFRALGNPANVNMFLNKFDSSVFDRIIEYENTTGNPFDDTYINMIINIYMKKPHLFNLN